MASYDGKAKYSGLSDGYWTDKLPDNDDVNYVSGQPLSDCSDHFSACAVGNSSQCVINDRPAHPRFSHSELHSNCLVKTNDDDDEDEDDDDDADVCRWHEAGRALRTFLSETSETSLLFGNDDTLVTSDCRQEPADRTISRAYARYSTTDDSDLCLNDCQSLRAKNYKPGSSSVPANDLLLLDDDQSQASFLPLFSKLRQKISCLDHEHREQLPSTSLQRRLKGHGRPSQLSTWSEFSSSDESDNHRFHANADHKRRHCSGSRRLKSDERWADDWWAASCSKEPGCCSAEKLPVSRHSSSRRRRKKSHTEKSSSLNDDGLFSLEAQEQKTWHQRAMSFTECLADVESNATDSDSIGHVHNEDDADDEDNGFANVMISDDISSSVMAPIACSFYCLPPESREKQTTRLAASSIDCSPVNSSVNDKDDLCMSSENELSAALGSGHILDHDGYHSSIDNDSCDSYISFGGILS